MGFCPNCGAELIEGDRFCRKCGTVINQNAQLNEPGQAEAFTQPAAVNLNVDNNVQQAYHSQKKSGRKILIPVIIIAAVLVIIGAAAVLTRGFASMRAKYTISQGNKYLSEGKYEEAILDFEKALSIDNRNMDSRLKLADLYIKTGNDDKALNLLKETLSLDKSNEDTYILLGSIYKRQKNYVELVKLYNEGLPLCKAKDKLQAEYDKLLAEITIPDIEAAANQNEKYTLPQAVQVQIGGDKFELPIDWKGKSADTSNAGTQKLEGIVQYINKPIVVNLNVVSKPAVVTAKKITDEGRTYSIEYNVPVVSLEGKYSENAAKLNSIIMEQFDKAQKENKKLADDSLQDEYLMEGMKYQFTANYEVKYNNDGLISIVMTYYSFTGGAHGGSYRVAFNYDLVEGKELQLQDLFSKDVNAVSVVKEEVTKQMQQDEEYAMYDSINIVNNYNKPFNFYFTVKGVTIWFDEYEVAPYAAGMPEFLVTRSVAIK